METGVAKLRYLVATHGRVLFWIGVLFVLLGVLGTAVGVASPPTEAVIDTAGQSTIETRTSAVAVVDGDHELYRDGEELTDEPVYPRSVTPDATVTATARGPAGVVVEQRLLLVYEASSPAIGVFRTQHRVLATTTGRIPASGRVETSAPLRVRDVAATLAAMRTEVGNAGAVTVSLAVETTYEDGTSTGTLTDRSPLVVADDFFRVPTLSASTRYGPTATTRRPVESRTVALHVPAWGVVAVPHVTGVFLLFVLVGLGGIAGVVRTSGRIDPDRERARIHRNRYDEWISVGDLPRTLSVRSSVVTVESLEALVDVAIDSQTRVVHDRSRTCYAVFTAGATYVFPSEDHE